MVRSLDYFHITSEDTVFPLVERQGVLYSSEYAYSPVQYSLGLNVSPCDIH